MSIDREHILSRVRKSLAPLTCRAPLPDWDADLVHFRSTKEAGDLWSIFSQRLSAVNGAALDSVPALVALLEKNGARCGYCDPTLRPIFNGAFDGRITVYFEFDRREIDRYEFGITRATGAIAETGTLILTDADTPSRLGALAPWTHVAVLTRGQIHADISSALAAHPPDPNIVWVTGPSKTADVEGILIEGVHGPGVQVALLVE